MQRIPKGMRFHILSTFRDNLRDFESGGIKEGTSIFSSHKIPFSSLASSSHFSSKRTELTVLRQRDDIDSAFLDDS